MPTAGMAMHEPGADQFSEREGSGDPFALPDPDLIDHLPLLFSTSSHSRRPGDRTPVHHQAASTAGFPSSCCFVNMAQADHAILLASAIVTLLPEPGPGR